MQTRSRERQEEYREQLGIYALSYLLFRHANLLHYLKARLILIALRDLLIVNYQHRRKDEHHREHNAEIEQRAEGRIVIVPVDISALYREGQQVFVSAVFISEQLPCHIYIVVAQRSFALYVQIGIEESEVLVIDGAQSIFVRVFGKALDGLF